MKQAAVIDITGEGVGANGMKTLEKLGFFKPPKDSTFSTGIHDAVEEVEVEDEVEESPPKEVPVYEKVFTGDKPVFLRMDEKEGKETSLIYQAKQLSIYEPKMKRVEIEKVSLICILFS